MGIWFGVVLGPVYSVQICVCVVIRWCFPYLHRFDICPDCIGRGAVRYKIGALHQRRTVSLIDRTTTENTTTNNE